MPSVTTMTTPSPTPSSQQPQATNLEQANRELHQEIERRQGVERQLREANELWQTTFDSMPDFISIHDRDYRIVKTNKALNGLLDRQPTDIVGQKCFTLFHGTCSPWETCPHRLLLASGQPHSCEVIDPHIGRPLQVSVFPLRKNGEVVGSIHIARDISQQKRLDEERQKNKNLESIAVLCGGLAHDFNNLLTAVSGYIDLAKLEMTSARLADWLDRAKMVTNLAAELTQQLLMFSKGGHPTFNEISVPALLQETLGSDTIGFSHIHPELRLANDLWPINGDHHQLTTVLRNIVYNAAEAMPKGGRLTIEAVNTPSGDDCPLDKDAVLLRLTDEGTGISPEIIDKVFDPYFTTTAKGAIKGKGLGLALCHSIVTKHHGLISISSVKDHGTTVSIYLPASHQSSAC